MEINKKEQLMNQKATSNMCIFQINEEQKSFELVNSPISLFKQKKIYSVPT